VPSLSQVRDRICNELGDGTYSPRQVAQDQKGWDIETVKLRMRELALSRIISDESIDENMQLFKYERPKSAGRAAELDRQRRATEPAPERSAPVAGTGVPDKVSNKDVAALINKIKSLGGEVVRATNSHWQVTNPKVPGKKVLISSTPKGGRTVENDRSRVRRQLLLAV
jgi:hypothetical protein